MKPRWNAAFERLDPPPGGLERLRHRLGEQDPPARPVWPLRLAVAAAAAAVAAILLWPSTGPDRRATDPVRTPSVEGPNDVVVAAAPLSDNPLLIAAGLAPLPAEPVELRSSAVAGAALSHVPIDDPDVVFYLVAAAVPHRASSDGRQER
ncbi:MAG: hypothetical protein HY825_02315 [Acidobacteria bacterium]|nr:hypothetical protein [Acidobacteriota bacterium]